MPMIGLGTWQYNDTLAQASLATAFSMGYRHVDTAYGYENQVGVGKALAASGLPLNELFITSKVAHPMAPPHVAISHRRLQEQRLNWGLL